MYKQSPQISNTKMYKNIQLFSKIISKNVLVFLLVCVCVRTYIHEHIHACARVRVHT